MPRNPWDEVLLMENPARRRKRRVHRNPSFAGVIPANISQGVDLQDMAAGVAGLAAAGWLPGQIVRNTTTQANQLLKIGLAIAAAFGAGWVVRQFASPSSAKAAVIGGLAGAGLTAWNTYSPVKLGGGRSVSGLIGPGVSRYPAPSVQPEFDSVKLS